jgi:putative FmdB family regulatory protein
MPIYEYRCEHCGHQLERMQKVSDPPLTDCPECAQPALRKLISAVAFRLKGGGWYETDFKKDNQKNLHDSGEKKETKTGGESATGATSDQGGTKSAADTSAPSPKPGAKPSEPKAAA